MPSLSLQSNLQNPARQRPNLVALRFSMPMLTPASHESQPEFFDRASHELREVIPSVNRRTVEILQSWRRSSNDQDLRGKASAQFPCDRFRHFGPRCVFVEHTIPASEDGQRPEIHYGREALLQMINWANFRIRNADAFSVLSDGHTPTRDEHLSGCPFPEVIGYVGPFYLGQLGDVSPRWAIYADEWVHQEDVDCFLKRQRRSPEVWINEPMERRTMDPIAALGAETPRLDCGVNPYSRASDGQTVLTYSPEGDARTQPPGPVVVGLPRGDPSAAIDAHISPALPRRLMDPNEVHGPVSFFQPRMIQGCPQTSSLPGEFAMPFRESDADLNLDTSGIDPQVLEQAVRNAVTRLLPIILQEIQSQFSGNAGDQPPPETSEETDSDLDDAVWNQPAGDLMDLEDQENLPDEDQREQYSAMNGECQKAFRQGWKHGIAATQRYSRSGDLHRVVARQQLRLQELSDQIARERRDAVRYSRLTDMSREFAFDPRDEAETCRDMTDKQFERHCSATIVKYARRDDVTNVELFADPSLQPDRYGAASTRVNVHQIERFSREAAAVAARKNATKRGCTTFEAEFDAICQRHGVTI